MEHEYHLHLPGSAPVLQAGLETQWWLKAPLRPIWLLYFLFLSPWSLQSNARGVRRIRIMYLRAGTTLSTATVTPQFPPPLMGMSQIQQFGGICGQIKPAVYKLPRWTFLHRGKCLSQSWSHTLHMQIFHLPVKGFTLDPLEDVLDTKGRSLRVNPWRKPRVWPSPLPQTTWENGGWQPAAMLAWTEANVSKEPSKDADTSSKSSSPCCLQ